VGKNNHTSIVTTGLDSQFTDLPVGQIS
jgi:hypothetical protein